MFKQFRWAPTAWGILTPAIFVMVASVVAISGVLLASPPAQQGPHEPMKRASAMFFRVGSVDELKAMTEVAVVVEVVGVKPGPTRTFDADEKDVVRRAPALPSNDVQLRVIETLRGSIEASPVWSFPLAPGRVEVEGDPVPRGGERYVLFLQRHDAFANRWVTPTLDGRLRIDPASGDLEALLPGGIGADLAAARMNGIREMAR